MKKFVILIALMLIFGLDLCAQTPQPSTPNQKFLTWTLTRVKNGHQAYVTQLREAMAGWLKQEGTKQPQDYKWEIAISSLGKDHLVMVVSPLKVPPKFGNRSISALYKLVRLNAEPGEVLKPVIKYITDLPKKLETLPPKAPAPIRIKRMALKPDLPRSGFFFA